MEEADGCVHWVIAVPLAVFLFSLLS